MSYFLCRLTPPRPSFPADMTAAEKGLMPAHAAYLQARAADGVAIAFGPVFDPAGAWGLVLAEAPDRAAMQAIIDADPIVAAGIGFSYTVHPMPSLTLRSAQAAA